MYWKSRVSATSMLDREHYQLPIIGFKLKCTLNLGYVQRHQLNWGEVILSLSIFIKSHSHLAFKSVNLSMKVPISLNFLPAEWGIKFWLHCLQKNFFIHILERILFGALKNRKALQDILLLIMFLSNIRTVWHLCKCNSEQAISVAHPSLWRQCAAMFVSVFVVSLTWRSLQCKLLPRASGLWDNKHSLMFGRRYINIKKTFEEWKRSTK